MINKKRVYKDLVKVHENNDIDFFNEINEKYNLNLKSIDEIAFIDGREVIDLSEYYVNEKVKYYKNYSTPRYIVNKKPLPKHKLKESNSNMGTDSYMVFHVLNGLLDNPDLDEVLEDVDLQVSKDTAINLLESKGFIIVDDDGKAFPTELGVLKLSSVSWVAFYEDNLNYFDFNDFERYIMENDTVSIVKNASNYVDEHYKLACENKDFHWLHNVFAARALIYLTMEEFKKALMEELKLFILKLNHIFLDEVDFNSYRPIEPVNIQNIYELEQLSSVKSLKRALYAAWIDMESFDMVMTKKEAYNYLRRAGDGEIIGILSAEIIIKHY